MVTPNRVLSMNKFTYDHIVDASAPSFKKQYEKMKAEGTLIIDNSLENFEIRNVEVEDGTKK